MLAAPGSRSYMIGTTRPGLPVVARVHLVTPSLLQVALPLVEEPSPAQYHHPIAQALLRPAGRECDSAACCRNALQSDAPPLWPARHSLPAARPRSHASGRVPRA